MRSPTATGARLMTTLRLTFLSSLVLELLASVSVALVAVAIGLRLLDGHLELRSALFVLVLAPEAYLPLAPARGRVPRQRRRRERRPAGLRGAGPAPPAPVRHSHPGARPGAHGPGDRLRCRSRYPGRDSPGPRRGEPDGRSRASCSPSPARADAASPRCSAVLLGFIQPDAGTVRVGAVDLAALDPDVWRQQHCLGPAAAASLRGDHRGQRAPGPARRQRV